MTHIETYKKNEKVIKIMRVIKAGTSRVFFVPVTIDGKRINNTLFARKYDAVNLGKQYLNS